MSEGRRYRVLGAVGRGGFGTVYRAELAGEGGFSKVVALKVLNADVEDVGEMAVRLRDEARVLGLLRHRAIVQVDGLVRLSGRWTVVMEYVEGADLKQVLASTGPFPPGVALTVIEEVAGALHVAYTRQGPEGRPLQLLHRDIKPSNIQVTAAGETKLLDFGVARAEFAGREAETRSLMFGSVGFMSPERLDFVDGPEGDVYALGAVLYELLSGEPFGKTSSKEARHEARLDAAVATLRAAGIDDGVVELVRTTMAYEPAARPVIREVERQAARLRAEQGGPSLRDWAEEHVSPVLHQRTDLADPLTGATLVEQGEGANATFGNSGPVSRGGAEPPPPGPAPQRASGDTGARTGSTVRTAGAVAAVGGLGLAAIAVVVAVVGVGAWWLSRDPDAPRDVPVAPATSVDVVEEPPAPPETVAVPSPVVKEEAPIQTKRAPVVVEERAPAPTPLVEPPAAAVAPPPSPARVSVTGDAKKVVLVGESGEFAPGEVPPGDYTVAAAFGDAESVVAGKVQLVPGGTVTLDCSSVFSRCRVR